MISLHCKLGFYTCQYGGCISSYYICDSYQVCRHSVDEWNCSICSVENHAIVSSVFCISYCSYSTCTCGNMYFHCTTQGCVPFCKVCDSISDCLELSDEITCNLSIWISLEQSLREPGYETVSNCSNFTMLPCEDDKLSLCYARSAICIYEVDLYDTTLHCRDGGHLKECMSKIILSGYECCVMTVGTVQG